MSKQQEWDADKASIKAQIAPLIDGIIDEPAKTLEPSTAAIITLLKQIEQNTRPKA